jgi:hypothetical protein
MEHDCMTYYYSLDARATPKPNDSHISVEIGGEREIDVTKLPGYTYEVWEAFVASLPKMSEEEVREEMLARQRQREQSAV